MSKIKPLFLQLRKSNHDIRNIFNMKIFSTLILITIFSATAFSQSKDILRERIEKTLKENYIYECGLYSAPEEILIDTILVDKEEFLIDYESYPKYRILNCGTLSNYLTLYGKGNPIVNDSLLLLYVNFPLINDFPYWSMLYYNKKYGLFFSFSKRKRYEAFNLILELLPEFRLKSKTEVCEYIDFIFRLYGVDNISLYRINKPDDIWTYPQHIYNKYLNSEKGGDIEFYLRSAYVVFNKAMLPENMPDKSEDVDKDIKTFKNYNKSIDTLRRNIKPIKIIFSGDIIRVTTYVSQKYSGNIELWKIEMTRRGEILDVERKVILEKGGFDTDEYYTGGLEP